MDRHCAGFTWIEMLIVIAVIAGLHDKRLTLRPAVVPGEGRVPIAWICGATPVPAGMEVRGEDKTDVETSWLPVECRGTVK